MKIIFYNDFHRTSTTAHSVAFGPTERLSEGQVKRIKKDLCGKWNCECSDKLGARGPGNVAYELNDRIVYVRWDQKQPDPPRYKIKECAEVYIENGIAKPIPLYCSECGREL